MLLYNTRHMTRQRKSTPDQLGWRIKLDRFAFALHISLKPCSLHSCHSLVSAYEHRRDCTITGMFKIKLCRRLRMYDAVKVYNILLL